MVQPCRNRLSRGVLLLRQLLSGAISRPSSSSAPSGDHHRARREEASVSAVDKVHDRQQPETESDKKAVLRTRLPRAYRFEDGDAGFSVESFVPDSFYLSPYANTGEQIVTG